MTIEEARRIVARIKYKPGWSFEVLPRNEVVYALRVLGSFPVRANPRENIVVDGAADIQFATGKEGLMVAVRVLVRDLEMHEVDEWLTYDGKHLREPHPTFHPIDPGEGKIRLGSR